MADFDPDAYLEKKTGKPFDPDAYLAKKQIAPTAPPTPGELKDLGVPDSPLRKALAEQGGPVVTVQTPQGPVRMTDLGGRVYEPEEVANQQALPEALWKERKLEQATSLLDTASNSLLRRLGDRGAVEAAAEKHPTENFLGNFVVPTPGLGKAKGVATGAEALARTSLPRVMGGIDAAAKAAPVAYVGGLNAFGRSAPDGPATQTAAETGTGAATAGLLALGMGKAGSALNSARGLLMQKAEQNVVNAINNPGIADRLRKVLGSTDPEVHRAFARRLLDDGSVKAFDSAESIASRAAKKIDQLGEGIGSYIEKGQAGFDQAAAGATQRNAERMGQYLDKMAPYGEAERNALRGWLERKAAEDAGATSQRLAQMRGIPAPAATELPPIPLLPPKPEAPALEAVPSMRGEFQAAAQRMRGTLTNEPEAVAALGRPAIETAASRIENEPNPSMRHLFRAKSALQGGVNYDELAPTGQELYRDSVRELKNAAHETIGKGLSGDDVEKFKGLNRQFSDQAKLLELAANKASRESGKKPGTMLGTEAAGHAAELLGGGIGAAAGAGIKTADNLFSRRVPSTLAALENAMGGAAGAVSRSGIAESPTAQADTAKVAGWMGLNGWLGGSPKKPEALTDVQQDPEAGLTPEQRKAKRAEDFAAEMRGR